MEGVDTVVTSLGHAPRTELSEALADAGYKVHAIGDCLSPRTVEEAVLEGLQIGARI
jgi:predicted NAD/FAD-dependent oxidoreductase